VRRYELEYTVGFGGTTQAGVDELGHYRVRWTPERVVVGVPWDPCVPGFGTSNTNRLRLWSARASDDFDLEAFNQGESWRAVHDKVRSENISARCKTAFACSCRRRPSTTSPTSSRCSSTTRTRRWRSPN
jgi:starch phosphorylase